MRRSWLILACLITTSISPASAELYRWTDDAGKIHITDNLATIPPAYRSRVRTSDTAPPAPPPASDTLPRQDEAAEPDPTPRRGPESPPPPASSSGAPDASIAELQQQIRAARQERQVAFERLRGERSVHTTPEFVRQRRNIADVGRTLVAVEQRLEALRAALTEAQQRQVALPAASAVLVDKEGRDATYWRDVMTTARGRLQQTQTARQNLLAALSTVTDSEGRPPERQGRAVLQHVQALEQLAVEIDAAEEALDLLREEAQQAGAPAAWLE